MGDVGELLLVCVGTSGENFGDGLGGLREGLGQDGNGGEGGVSAPELESEEEEGDVLVEPTDWRE